MLQAEQPPQAQSRYRIRVKGSSQNLICKPILINDRIHLQIVLPSDVDRKLVIHIPGDHWVFLRDPAFEKISLRKGTVLNLDPETQKAYEYTSDLSKNRHLNLFEAPGEYEFIFSKDMDADWEEIIPEAYCPVDVSKIR